MTDLMIVYLHLAMLTDLQMFALQVAAMFTTIVILKMIEYIIESIRLSIELKRLRKRLAEKQRREQELLKLTSAITVCLELYKKIKVKSKENE